MEHKVAVDGGSPALVSTVAAAGVSTTAIPLTVTDASAPCGLLTYHVRAFDGTYESLPSNTDSATAGTCPLAPENLQLAIVDADSVDLTWTDISADETGSILQRQINNGGFSDYQTLGAGANLQYADNGLTCGTVYDYRAVAVRDGDRSIASNVVRRVGCAPSNDEFVGADVIGNTPFTATIINAQYASIAVDDPVHSCRYGSAGTGTHTLWWSFTPSVNGKLMLDTSGSAGSMSDTLMSVYTGTLGNFTPVACNDDASGSVLTSSIANLAVTAGRKYTLYVSRYSSAPSTNAGTVVLNASFAANPIVVVTPTIVNVTEGGAGASYAVALAAKPTANVTVSVSGDVDCATNVSVLTFTSTNFNVAQNGDGNGDEISPANAYVADGAVAIDMNSGATTSTSCTNTGKDRHRFFNDGFSIPNAAVIKGIQVRLKAKADSGVGAPMVCVQLSGDGGLTRTAPVSTPTLGATFAEFTLGSAAFTWGRTWDKNSLSNANFRVRVINVSSSTERDFRLDRLAVKVTYQ